MAKATSAPTGNWFGGRPAKLAPLDRGEARTGLGEVAKAAREEGLSSLADAIEAGGPDIEFLSSALDLSPFLRDCVRRDPAMLDRLRTTPAPQRIEELTGAVASLGRDAAMTEARLMAELRRAKTEAHALIAFCDLARVFDAPATVERLSVLADACTGAAVSFLLRDAHRQGKIALPDPADPSRGSGWILLAMGKLGAHELNFSSDIDLISFFDPEAPAITEPFEANELFARLTRRLVRILQDRTGDGYVFRTDLRLRPDPGSTPLSIPVGAALHYYESRGQNWERAAMIKARPVAGDIEAGEAFLAELRPYVWRKYMDFAAIADVHSIKRQIHAHKGHGEIAVKGHNVKLGRGGIREIEFFVQTQQLIAGGRFRELRGRETVAMLDELSDRGWISPEARDALACQYWFLRDVEHAIQMVADEQTHLLPEDDEGLERVARMRGFANATEFSAAFRASLQTVEKHYAALFETAPQLSTGVGNLVFTGDVDDPDTLQTLSQLGFERPSDICRAIRGWHFGRYRATQSAEARERLTELTPALLEAFGGTRRADEALMRFDAFLAGLPAGIQLFSLLQTNPALLQLLAMVMGAAPRLAAIITKRPHVFDGLLDPMLLSELPDRAYLAGRLASFLEGADLHEERLDRLRIFAAEQKFLIGIRLLTGAIDAARAGKAFSDLADLTIGAALDAVEGEFALRHGRVAGQCVALVGMGKLGSRELTAGSDVDMILLYDHDPAAEESDGEKPLAPAVYFARLTQRLIAAVSAPTAEGILYEIDLRLRPSGNKGPVATHIEAFRKYQRDEAETWEHMALTRARVVAGDEDFADRLSAEIDGIVGRRRDFATVAAAARSMRALIEAEKPPRDGWDLKLAPGGLIDLEFIAQVASLTGRVDAVPRPTSTAEVLRHLAESFADLQTRDELAEAHRLYMSVTQILRLCLQEDLPEAEFPPGLSDLLARSTDVPDLVILRAQLQDTAKSVRAHFHRLLRKNSRNPLQRATL